MVKKIGDIALSLLMIGTCYLYAQDCLVTLAVSDKSGQNLTEVQVGIPFYLIVSVSAKSRSLPTPTLTGVDRSFIKGQSTSQDISMINGDLTATTRYIYVMLLDDQGSYTFGPARCDYQGQEILSNTVTVTAGLKTTVEVTKQQGVFATIFFGKKEALYQEPVECFVRFYYSIDGIRLQEMSEPIFKGCIAEPLSQPRSGVETVDGVQYRYLEWKTVVYPTTTGEITVTPIALRYLEPHKRRSMSAGSLFSDFFDMMGGFEEQKEMYTNGAQLTVLPLPPHDPAVHAVGNFTDIKASAANTTVTVGEGIIFSLEIVGEGNLFALSHPSLEIPANCTFYEGNATYHSEQKPVSKTFEYVLQAHEAGTYTVPSQKFTYYNSANQTYRTLHTDPITVQVTGSIASKKQNNDSIVAEPQEISTASGLSIMQQGAAHAYTPFMIPWFWYLWMVLSAILFFIGTIVYRIYKKAYDKRSSIRRYEFAFKHARKQLEMVRRKKFHGYVYSIFMHMLAERFKVEVQTLTEDAIEQQLISYFSVTQLAQWRLFYVTMNEAAFANTTEESDIIFTQAFQWLNTFERIL